MSDVRAEDHPFRGKTIRALGLMLALIAVPYLSPRLSALRVVSLGEEPITEAELDAQEVSEPVAAPAVSTGELESRASENHSANALPTAKQEPVALAAGEGGFLERPELLDAFYTQLQARERGGPGLLRVAHYGDSLITSDYASGTARRLLQEKLGDGGHGFLAIANPWEWYFHNDVAHSSSSGWRMSRVTGPLAKDGAYGPGGVVFRGGPGATASFGTAKDGDYGRKVSRFEVLYAARPDGGELGLKSSDGQELSLSTVADVEQPRRFTVEVPDGEAKLTLRVTRGEVKLYGVALERTQGLVYDALGALGARARVWDRMEAEPLAEVLKLRPPQLVMIQLGTNESEDGGVNKTQYVATLQSLLRKWKTAAPESSLLMVAPPDRAEKSPSGGFRSNRTLMKIVALQREVAQAENVAFFDTFRAMGGEGAMGKWLMMHPPLCSGDLTHPTPAGADALGRLLVQGLLEGYGVWQAGRRDNRTPSP